MFIEDGTVMATDEMMASIKSAYGKDSSCMIVITCVARFFDGPCHYFETGFC